MLRLLSSYLLRLSLSPKNSMCDPILIMGTSFIFHRSWLISAKQSLLIARWSDLNPSSTLLALAIMGEWKDTSRHQLYEKLGWESLSDRRWSRYLILFLKLLNKLAPGYTRHQIPLIDCSNYILRNQAIIRRIKARKQRFKSSFYPNCFKRWYNLTPEVHYDDDIAHARLGGVQI